MFHQKIRVEREIAGRTLALETGTYAKLSAGSVTIQYGETFVFAAIVRSDPRPGIDFFPLQVEYRERRSAAGKFPGGFLKREGRPTNKEILTARLVDRPLRPLFPKGFMDEVQIHLNVLAFDGQQDPDVLAGIAASAATHISDVPFTHADRPRPRRQGGRQARACFRPLERDERDRVRPGSWPARATTST